MLARSAGCATGADRRSPLGTEEETFGRRSGTVWRPCHNETILVTVSSSRGRSRRSTLNVLDIRVDNLIDRAVGAEVASVQPQRSLAEPGECAKVVTDHDQD